ncbi:NADPH-dependent F420 reductase [Pyxidicoccus fallax]|uniref:NADPH-dependent F420 reductase n=1 Tax=Pyxidicoccus fallax TaxID=394095 RepID=A0A848LFJ1_9BACT|nr:NADPH-dependent F420 reductase [Pyxidicoccus fallax]NMO17112.1 NADPH-dependent F420 reductase [Pyxidicoccus fallax]NPC78823.1 NADPH-dependent F420 reductase [Pyxidicoccus fallax]
MRIGIIGAGSIGQALAGHMVKSGHEVVVSNSRGPESLAGLVAKLGPGARAGTREEAAKAELVVLSVPWEQVPEALSGLPAWNGRILLDATNPVLLPGFRLADLKGSTSSEIVASLAPGARVVKAANTLLAAVLAADPRHATGRRVLFMSGDDAGAKTEVRGLFEKVGFAPIDLGPLANGKLQQFPGGPLAVINLLKQD